jgi:hypothetical protein
MESQQGQGDAKWHHIVLVDEESLLVIDGVLKVVFRNRPSFRLIWTVCEAMKDNPEYQMLGGVPPEDLEKKCELAGFGAERAALNTRWHDEIELRRCDKDESGAAAAVKSIRIEILKKDESFGGKEEDVAVKMLRSVFHKSRAPAGSRVDPKSTLFSVRAKREEIFLFWTKGQAASAGHIAGLGGTEFTLATWDLGYLYWKEKVEVDRTGHCGVTVSLRIINLGPTPVGGYQYWYSGTPFARPTKAKTRAWLRDGTPLDTRVLLPGESGSSPARSMCCVSLPTIMSGETVAFSYFTTSPMVCRPGDNQLSMNLTHPCARVGMEMCFSRHWCVRSPIAFVGERDQDIFQPVQHGPDRFVWERFFPTVPQTYQIHFHLSRSRVERPARGGVKTKVNMSPSACPPPECGGVVPISPPECGGVVPMGPPECGGVVPMGPPECGGRCSYDSDGRPRLPLQ